MPSSTTVRGRTALGDLKVRKIAIQTLPPDQLKHRMAAMSEKKKTKKKKKTKAKKMEKK